MYLKSIEIHGFKSFANKIKFNFKEGITGIVGPNGSGKSNVADAVRWVLGEQKIKQLRGNKMEDVIFAGTAQRKPQSYAFVSIAMDNSDHNLNIDFDEVIISRRVYRSGESEYMINGSVCRLRDVQELLYDTGIGKEGYSIIGQGQIDKILQGKPEERRELFDEAAGIVKYKKRKNIAMRKLENERLNLSRVNDILSELKRRVGPLQKQSEAAEKFVVFKNELKRFDINLFLCENGDIKDRIKEYSEKEIIVKEELEKANVDLESTKEEYERISILLNELDEEINGLKNHFSQISIVRESFLGQINVLNEQINSLNSAQNNYCERVNELNAELKTLQSEKEQAEINKNENQAELTSLIHKSNDQDSLVLDLQSKNEDTRNQIEAYKEQLIDIIRNNGEITARIQRLGAMMEQMSLRKDALQNDLEKFTSDRTAIEKKVSELNEEHIAALDNVKLNEDSIRAKEEELSKARNELRKNNDELEVTKDKLLKVEAALESLRNITERYEGYGNTIKEIMKLKEKKPGIHGVVADIIRTEQKYETAIETALGGNIQNVVTDTEGTAKEVIEFLKKNKLGRATFLPLKAVTGRGEFKNTDIFNENGVIGLASSLVDTESRYEGVANYLLGKIIVVDTVEHALTIARKYNYSVIIVTLEGELLNRGGSISGGAYKNKSNLLGRRREIDDFEKAVSKLKDKRADIADSIVTVKENISEIEFELNDLKASLQENKLVLNTVSINLKTADDKRKEIQGFFDSINKEKASIDSQSDNITNENSFLEESLVENKKNDEIIKSEIVKLEKELSDSKAKEAEELFRAQQFKVEQTKLLQQNDFLTETLQKCDTNISKITNDIETLEKNNKDSVTAISEKKKQIEEITASIENADKEIADYQDKLTGLQAEKEKRSGAHKEFLEKREKYAEHIANLDKEAFRFGQMKEKLEEKFENKSNYIWEEYQLTFNNALELKDPELTDTKEMREKIAELKTSIRGLGSINVAAIEEYKEVKERFEFLSNQHEDLLKAETDLVKIIKDLDKEMRKQFNEEFKKIKTEFARVFREMFGGGYGTIELEEDVDILDAGISIIAQPPGKKLQNMMQLSGGEKALTAIAILFTIQNLKPSPFCILDEIEAALDDSNIERYAKYLAKLAEDIQFIVITHRKGTMEAADQLYGITMQERGVSSLISVDLEDVKEEELA